MEHNLQQPFFSHQHNHMNSGLTRYQSAPSAYFASLFEKDFHDDFLINRPTSPETEKIFSRFLQGSSSNTCNNLLGQNVPKQNTDVLDIKIEQEQDAMVASFDSQTGAAIQTKVGNYSSASQSTYQQGQRHQVVSNQKLGVCSFQGRGGDQGAPCQASRPAEGSSTLVRHRSSPADMLSSVNFENVYAAAIKRMGEIGEKRESSFASSSTGNTSRVAETPSSYHSGLPPRSGEDAMPKPARTLSGTKRLAPADRTLSGGILRSKTENVDAKNRRPPLAHHLSLPKALSEIENFLEISESVPCKVRAKRGCATHPRSIAERVRRTKISERMRKLQEHVPNMDKQTNTAGMLDLAVEYIKDLQNQIKTLSAKRATCSCSNS